MNKLKMHSRDLTDENIAKIRGLFPNCVSEATDENGKLRLAVDFDQLRQELSDSIVEGPGTLPAGLARQAQSIAINAELRSAQQQLEQLTEQNI